MAATNYTPIQLYYSTTASAAPVAGNLANGELAINITDGKLYYKDNGGVVQVIATKGAGTIGGSNTQIQYNNSGALAGSSAMTFNSGTNTVTLTTLNLTNALGATYGGTAQSSYTQGDILYSSATNTLSKLGIGTVNYILTSTGSVPQWVAPTSVTVQTANNLAGGAAGSVPYQSAPDTTTFLSIGAANRVMTSSGTAPQWVTSLTGLTGVSSSSITNTSLTSGRLVYSTTGGAQTDDADLTFNGTTLSAGGYSTSGLSTLVKTVTIGNSNFDGSAVFAAATPAKLYIGTGTVTDTTSAIGATNAVGAISSLAITPIAATNTSVTYTNASTLYIAGAPSAGTNVTITNPYALYVAAGNTYLGGKAAISTTPIQSAVLSVGGTGTEATSLATVRTTAAFIMTPYSSSNWATAMGSLSGQIQYIQGIDSSAATARDLSLQPYGGYVGIGATNPTQALEVNGNAYINVASGNPYLQIKTGGAGNNPYIRLQASTTYWDLQGTFSSGNDDLIFGYGGTTFFDMTNTANTGIGGAPVGAYGNRRSLEVFGNGVAAINFNGSIAESMYNTYLTSAGQQTYYATGPAAIVNYNNNTTNGFAWLLYPSGTAGTAVGSATQAMALDSTSLWVGTAAGSYATTRKLAVNQGITLGYGLYTFAAVDTNSGGDLILTSNAYPANTGSNSNISFKLGSSGGGGPTEYMRLVSNTGQLRMINGVPTAIDALRGSYFGYSSSSYQALVIGATSGNVTPCINVDPQANVSGSFSGTGGEVMFRNGVGFITPNTANTTFLPILTFDSAGYGFKSKYSIGVGDATPATSGAGITFPATQSASSDANTLDDYEEGSFAGSVTVRGSGTAGTYGLSIGNASYTKIGRVVTIQMAVSITSASGGTGYMQITGLPFANACQAIGPLEGNYLTLNASTAQIVAEFISASGQTIIYFREMFTSGTGQDFPISNVSSSSTFTLTMTYQAST